MNYNSLLSYKRINAFIYENNKYNIIVFFREIFNDALAANLMMRWLPI